MNNFYITDDFKLRKIYGYKSFYDFGSPIRGMYATSLGGTEYLLVAANDKLYYFLKEDLEAEWQDIAADDELEEEEEHTPIYGVEPTLIGTIGTGSVVSFFTFDKKIYILSGKYHSWDGTTLTEVEGYTPLVFINTPPAGGGLIYEEINMLSAKKHQTFNGDGTSKDFYIAQQQVTSIDKVFVNGVEKTVTTDYTVNTTNGKVSFTTAPSQGMDNVDIYWTLDDGDRSIIEGMKYGTIFGGDVDTRVFLYGNPNCQNRTYFSGLEDGVPSVEYFPAAQQVDIGPSNFALTDLTRQYDRLLATTNRPEAYYLTISTEALDVTLANNTSVSRYVPTVATFPLNEIHGNVAPGQGQLINNYPVTVDKNALIMWKATNVRDEKNMEDISQKIKLDLIDLDLSNFITLDHQSANQLWFGTGERIYIYNYYNKTFSRLFLNDTISHFADLGNNVYTGLLDGRVVKWGDQFSDFDGEIIDAHWEMNFSDFDVAYLRKTMNRLWVLMQPQGSSSAEIGYISNRESSNTRKRISYNIQVLNEVDFSKFSFQISNNPQPFRLKMKAKKFTNLKVTIDNTERTDCTILQLALRVESFGESK